MLKIKAINCKKKDKLNTPTRAKIFKIGIPMTVLKGDPMFKNIDIAIVSLEGIAL